MDCPRQLNYPRNFSHQQTLRSREKEKKTAVFCHFVSATLCPRDIHLIAPLFVAPSRTSLKFVGFEEEERRLGLVPLVSTSPHRRDMIYNLHQVSLSRVRQFLQVSPTRSYFSSFFLSTLSDYHQSICIGNSIQRERKRESYVYMNSIYK